MACSTAAGSGVVVTDELAAAAAAAPPNERHHSAPRVVPSSEIRTSLKALPVKRIEARTRRELARLADRCQHCDPFGERCSYCTVTHYVHEHANCDSCGTRITRPEHLMIVETPYDPWRNKWCKTCKKPRHRDRSACLSIMLIVLCLLRKGARPSAFCRRVPWSSS